MNPCSNTGFFVGSIGLYAFIVFIIVGMAIYVLYKIVVLKHEYEKRKDLSNTILVMILFLTVLTVLTYVATIYVGGRIMSGHEDDFGYLNNKKDKTAIKFFGFRSVMLTFSCLAAWFIYYRFTKDEDFTALRWAFILENIMIIVFVVTIVAFMTQYDRYKVVCDKNAVEISPEGALMKQA